MSAKRQAHERQFVVDELLRTYSSRLGVTRAEESLEKNKPATRGKRKQPRESSKGQARGSSAPAVG